MGTAPSAFGTEKISGLRICSPGLRKMRGMTLSAADLFLTVTIERRFPDRDRSFHVDWNDLKESRALGSALPMRSSSFP